MANNNERCTPNPNQNEYEEPIPTGNQCKIDDDKCWNDHFNNPAEDSIPPYEIPRKKPKASVNDIEQPVAESETNRVSYEWEGFESGRNDVPQTTREAVAPALRSGKGSSHQKQEVEGRGFGLLSSVVSSIGENIFGNANNIDESTPESVVLSLTGSQTTDTASGVGLEGAASQTQPVASPGKEALNDLNQNASSFNTSGESGGVSVSSNANLKSPVSGPVADGVKSMTKPLRPVPRSASNMYFPEGAGNASTSQGPFYTSTGAGTGRSLDGGEFSDLPLRENNSDSGAPEVGGPFSSGGRPGTYNIDEQELGRQEYPHLQTESSHTADDDYASQTNITGRALGDNETLWRNPKYGQVPAVQSNFEDIRPSGYTDSKFPPSTSESGTSNMAGNVASGPMDNKIPANQEGRNSENLGSSTFVPGVSGQQSVNETENESKPEGVISSKKVGGSGSSGDKPGSFSGGQNRKNSVDGTGSRIPRYIGYTQGAGESKPVQNKDENEGNTGAAKSNAPSKSQLSQAGSTFERPGNMEEADHVILSGKSKSGRPTGRNLGQEERELTAVRVVVPATAKGNARVNKSTSMDNTGTATSRPTGSGSHLNDSGAGSRPQTQGQEQNTARVVPAPATGNQRVNKPTSMDNSGTTKGQLTDTSSAVNRPQTQEREYTAVVSMSSTRTLNTRNPQTNKATETDNGQPKGTGSRLNYSGTGDKPQSQERERTAVVSMSSTRRPDAHNHQTEKPTETDKGQPKGTGSRLNDSGAGNGHPTQEREHPTVIKMSSTRTSDTRPKPHQMEKPASRGNTETATSQPTATSSAVNRPKEREYTAVVSMSSTRTLNTKNQQTDKSTSMGNKGPGSNNTTDRKNNTPNGAASGVGPDNNKGKTNDQNVTKTVSFSSHQTTNGKPPPEGKNKLPTGGSSSKMPPEGDKDKKPSDLNNQTTPSKDCIKCPPLDLSRICGDRYITTRCGSSGYGNISSYIPLKYRYSPCSPRPCHTILQMGCNETNNNIDFRARCEEILKKCRGTPSKTAEPEVQPSPSSTKSKANQEETPQPAKPPKKGGDCCMCCFYKCSCLIFLFIIAAGLMLTHLMWWEGCGVSKLPLSEFGWVPFPGHNLEKLNSRDPHEFKFFMAFCATLVYFANFILVCFCYLFCKCCCFPPAPKSVCSCKEFKVIYHIIHGAVLAYYIFWLAWKEQEAGRPSFLTAEYDCVDFCFIYVLILLLLGVIAYVIYSLERRRMLREVGPSPNEQPPWEEANKSNPPPPKASVKPSQLPVPKRVLRSRCCTEELDTSNLWSYRRNYPMYAYRPQMMTPGVCGCQGLQYFSNRDYSASSVSRPMLTNYREQMVPLTSQKSYVISKSGCGS